MKARSYKKQPSSKVQKKWLSILQNFAGQNAKQHLGRKQRILVDSNVWISAIVFGGETQRCLENAYLDYTVVVTEDILSEVVTQLKEQFNPTYRLLRHLRICLDAQYVETKPAKVQVRDPKDEHIVSAAEQLGCMIIVSGDKDLLTLDHPDILILSVMQYHELNKTPLVPED